MVNKGLNIRPDAVSSEIFGFPVVDWHCNSQRLSPGEVLDVINLAHQQFNARLISVVLTNPSPLLVSTFMQSGFEFIQYRLNIYKELEHFNYNFYPFIFTPLSNKNELKELLKNCNNLKFDDRYSVDPAIGKLLVIKRNKHFLKNSFSQPDEWIYLLKNQSRGTIDGFRSYKITGNNDAAVLLGGTLKKDKIFDYDKILNYLEFSALFSRHIKNLQTIVSVNNHEETNRYISELGYRVIFSTLVLRKFLY